MESVILDGADPAEALQQRQRHGHASRSSATPGPRGRVDGPAVARAARRRRRQERNAGRRAAFRSHPPAGRTLAGPCPGRRSATVSSPPRCGGPSAPRGASCWPSSSPSSPRVAGLPVVGAVLVGAAGLRGAGAGGGAGRGRPAARAHRPVHRAGAVAPVRAGRPPHPQPLRRAGPTACADGPLRDNLAVDRPSGSTPRSRRTTASPSGARRWPRPGARSTWAHRPPARRAGAPATPTDDPSSTRSTGLQLEALDAQRAAADRLDRVQADAQARLRLLDARMDEALARAVELSAQSERRAGRGHGSARSAPTSTAW